MIILTNFCKRFNFFRRSTVLIKISSFVEHAMCLVQVTEVTNYLTILTNFCSLKLLGGVTPSPPPPPVATSLKNRSCFHENIKYPVFYISTLFSAWTFSLTAICLYVRYTSAIFRSFYFCQPLRIDDLYKCVRAFQPLLDHKTFPVMS